MDKYKYRDVEKKLYTYVFVSVYVCMCMYLCYVFCFAWQTFQGSSLLSKTKKKSKGDHLSFLSSCLWTLSSLLTLLGLFFSLFRQNMHQYNPKRLKKVNFHHTYKHSDTFWHIHGRWVNIFQKCHNFGLFSHKVIIWLQKYNAQAKLITFLVLFFHSGVLLVIIHFHYKEKSSMNILHMSLYGLQMNES